MQDNQDVLGKASNINKKTTGITDSLRRVIVLHLRKLPRSSTFDVKPTTSGAKYLVNIKQIKFSVSDYLY